MDASSCDTINRIFGHSVAERYVRHSCEEQYGHGVSA
jgi:hypothetical protein